MAVAAMQGADQHVRSSLKVRYLAQGHLHMQTRGIKSATLWHEDIDSTSEPQPPWHDMTL